MAAGLIVAKPVGMVFTILLFITDLACKDPEYQVIAKVPVASVISGIIAYILLMRTPKVND